MKFRVCIFFLIIVGSIHSANGQSNSFNYDTNYIKSFYDYLVISLVTSRNTNRISVADNSGNDVNFSTNLPVSIGVGIDYKWLTFEYTNSFGIAGDPDYGLTETKGIGFGLTSRRFWFRNFYQQTSGYYLENPKYFNPNFNPEVDKYPHRSDVQSSIYYATLNYGFNYKRFSNTAALWQLERQKKSAGSLTAGVTFAYNTFTADSALVPKNDLVNFGDDARITDLYFTMYGANFGYLYTASFLKSRKLYLTFALVPGISMQMGKKNLTEKQSLIRQNAVGFHNEFRIGTGWNGDLWYANVTFTSYYISTNFSDQNPFSQGYEFFRFVVGYKIKMRPTKNRFLKKIGL